MPLNKGSFLTKRPVAVFLALVLVLSCSACKNADSTPTGEATAPTAQQSAAELSYDLPPDDHFPSAMGLSDVSGITCGTSCMPLMMSVAYSFVIATVEDEADIAAVAKDFRQNIDWNRWICVSADKALIASKGNMVLCLVSTGDLFDQTAQAILSCGWTEVETLK